jgi:TetR/AcrR family transcriptional repressor of mexJK operon
MTLLRRILPMSKIEQNKERKRRAILKAAQGIFLSEGYVLASMDKIAAEAQLTKQTLYRYFPSKVDLFQATLSQIGKSSSQGFTVHLENPDTREALLGFAKDFIHFHLSDEHIAIFRLLVAEGTKAQEATCSFLSVGPHDTDAALSSLLSERFNIEDTKTIISLWTGMLFALRSGVLIGMQKPDKQQIDKHAINATDFLLAAISSYQLV